MYLFNVFESVSPSTKGNTETVSGLFQQNIKASWVRGFAVMAKCEHDAILTGVHKVRERKDDRIWIRSLKCAYRLRERPGSDCGVAVSEDKRRGERAFYQLHVMNTHTNQSSTY